MAAFYLFCPGSLLSKKHKLKSKGKLKFDRENVTTVDPLYETIPTQTRYSQDNRGKHSFAPTGKLPPSILNSSTNTARVLYDYSPPAGDNQTIGVSSGHTVFVVQQEKDWSYVIDEHNQLGYVPSDILSPIEAETWDQVNSCSNSSVNTSPFQLGKSDSPKNTPPSTPSESLYSKVSKSGKSSHKKPVSNLHIATSPPQNVGTVHNAFATFTKTPREIRTLLHSYRSRQENDLTVRKGEQVTVLNNSDRDWLWVVRGDGEEGFIPACYSLSASNYYSGCNSSKHKLTKTVSHSTGYKSASSTTNSNQLSAAFSDHLRITPVRSVTHSPADLLDHPLHSKSEPTFDKQKRMRHRKSPERMLSREVKCTTPNSLKEKRAVSFDYIDSKKHQDVFSSSPQLTNLYRTSSSHPIKPSRSPHFTPPHPQTSKQFVNPQSTSRHTRPAPAPPCECVYENLNFSSPQPYAQPYPRVILQDNIYMNAPGLDANGKPSLVPSIMTMEDRIQLMDKDPVPFSHSCSDHSIGQASSLGDVHSVSEFNQHQQRRNLIKGDVV